MYYYPSSVRPTITISKTTVDELIEKESYRTYEVGEVITIDTESFNVISDNGDTVTMLAQYNIDSSAPYKQTTKQIWTTFSDSGGWEYTPGPKEIDVQIWSDDAKILLNNYVNYLNTEYNVSVTGDFVTVSELGDLVCVYPIGNSTGGFKTG